MKVVVNVQAPVTISVKHAQMSLIPLQHLRPAKRLENARKACI
jgi:hypothetical protein